MRMYAQNDKKFCNETHAVDISEKFFTNKVNGVRVCELLIEKDTLKNFLFSFYNLDR